MCSVSATMREPECDIDAQLRALVDEDHPKVAVFLAPENALGNRKLPDWLFVEKRAEGTLITTSATLAAHFQELDHLTDNHMAAILGYPETKGEVLKTGDATVVQALDANGCVVFEAAASYQRLPLTVAAAKQQMPPGGKINVTTLFQALNRRDLVSRQDSANLR